MIFNWNISPPEISVSTFQWDENRFLQMIGRDRNTIINYDCLFLNVFSGSFWIKAEATRGDSKGRHRLWKRKTRKPQWKHKRTKQHENLFLQTEYFRIFGNHKESNHPSEGRTVSQAYELIPWAAGVTSSGECFQRKSDFENKYHKRIKSSSQGTIGEPRIWIHTSSRESYLV